MYLGRSLAFPFSKRDCGFVAWLLFQFVSINLCGAVYEHSKIRHRLAALGVGNLIILGSRQGVSFPCK